MSILQVLKDSFNPVWSAHAFGLTIVYYAISSYKRRASLPPGPSGWPLIGVALQWPSKDRWLTWVQWAQQYGDLVYANVTGTDIMFINSMEVATQLLEVQGANFSDRARMYFLCEMVGYKNVPSLQNAGPAHTAHRRSMIQEFGSRRDYAPLEDVFIKATLRCLRGMEAAPKDLHDHVRNLNGTIMLWVTYGYEVTTVDDNFIRIAKEAYADVVLASIPGAFLVDVLPFLRYIPQWFPGAGFQKVASRMIAVRKRLVDEPYQFTANELAAGRAVPSFVASHASTKDNDFKSEKATSTKWAATDLYLTGSVTTGSIMMTLVLCMLLNPEVQQRAQTEIDTVVGSERLPRLADQKNLPYLNALLKEVIRWGTVVPEGFPHVARNDAHHAGYFIPKGTIMIPNVWGMAHDPVRYRDPHAFSPERFLSSTPAPDPNFIFGFGRRTCVGQRLVEASLYVLAAHMLALFNIERAKGIDGQLVDVKVEYKGEGVTFPTAFPYKCSYRSEHTRKLFTDALDILS